MLSIIIVLSCVFVFLHLKRDIQFIIVTIATFLPLSFGNLGGIEDFLVIRWLIPVFFLITLNDVFPINLSIPRRSMNIRGIEIFVLAISILFIWALISYIRHPVQADYKQGSASVTGGLSLYYGIFTNILLFFSVIFYFFANMEYFDVSKWLKLLIYFSIITGIVRVLSFFLDFDMPFMAGAFGYRTHGSAAYRVGGLTEVVWLGISALTAHSYLDKEKKINFFGYIIFIIFLIISGGRTILVGFSVALIIYSLFFDKAKFLSLTISIITVIILFALFAPREVLDNQFDRLFRFEGGIKGQDKSRYEVYTRSIQNFYNNPIFGKGISPYSEFIYITKPSSPDFIREQLFGGGHGSYISLLSTFGIGGILYFVIMVFGSIGFSFNQLRRYYTTEPELAAISLFCFIYLIITSIYSITGNNGYLDPTLFFVVGLIAVIRISEN